MAAPQTAFSSLSPTDSALVYQNNILGTILVEQLVESARGLPGLTGPKGASFYTGSGAPSSLLGTIGDSYVDSATGNLWQRGSGGWVNTGLAMVPVQSVAGLTGSPNAAQVAGALAGTTLAPLALLLPAAGITTFSATGVGASSATVVDSWDVSVGHSAFYIVEARQSGGVAQAVVMLAMTDGVNVTILPFASASTGSAVAAVSASLSGTTVSLTAQAITSAVSVSGVRILLP